jgi:DNA-directed RNA polymerase subunit RPC12/RpoP
MTKDQIKAYVEHKGVRCPYCESCNLVGSSLVDWSEMEAREDVECGECGNKWMNIFTLTGIAPRE